MQFNDFMEKKLEATVSKVLGIYLPALININYLYKELIAICCHLSTAQLKKEGITKWLIFQTLKLLIYQFI